MKQLAIVVELDKCIGCKGGCQVACKWQNELPLGPSRSKLYTMGPTGKFPDLQMYFMPVMCQQCENPSCVNVCPTGACYKDEEDGVIYIDRTMCIGCKSCIDACPFKCNYFIQERYTSDKCNLCFNNRDEGNDPACVRNCAGNALHYGDINDPDSEVYKLLAANADYVYTLKDDKGNKPSGRFILKNCNWIEELPFEFEEKLNR